MAKIDDNWLPVGLHWGLTITHNDIGETGRMPGGEGQKTVLHTTEGPTFAGADETLRQNGDEPHFLLDPKTGKVVQYIALSQLGKALQHPPGTPETNRANAVQIEMVGYAADTPKWTTTQLTHVAALCSLISHRTGVRQRAPVPFHAAGLAKRLNPYAWQYAEGYYGHEHVPNNDHEDPGAFPISQMFNLMNVLRSTHA